MSRQIMVGGVAVGGGAPVSIQSMCNTATEDVEATVQQILRLEQAGCEIIRVAVPTEEAARAVPAIKARIHIPLVADIHFSHRLALMAAERGVDAIVAAANEIKTINYRQYENHRLEELADSIIAGAGVLKE